MQFEETKQSLEQESDVAGMLKLSDLEFMITMIREVKALFLQWKSDHM